MNSNTVSEKDNFFENIEMRYPKGKLVEKDKGVYFSIDNCDYADQARIIDPEINTDDLELEKIYKIFLINPSDNKKDWFASLEWADKEKNPWEKQSYRSGDFVTGIVIRYVHNFGVIIRLKDGIEAFLHINEIKGLSNTRSNNIQDILYIGDQIYAEIIEFSVEYLECKLSINNMYKRKKKEYKYYKQTKHYTSSDSDVVEKKFITYPEDTQVIIIDDNSVFTQTLNTWLEHQNVDCMTSLDINTINKIIADNNGCHVILDYDLEDNDLEKNIAEILCNYKPPVLLCSSHKEAEEKIKKYPDWFFTPKPFSNKTLDAFLRNKFDELKDIEKIKTIQVTQRKAEGIWEAAFPEVDDLIEKITAFIENICTEIHALAGIWVKLEREGVFSILTQYGMNAEHPEFSNLQAGLVHTIVSNTIEKGQAMQESIDKAGPLLNDIAPQDTKQLFAFPIDITEDKKADSVLLFFCKENSDFNQGIKCLQKNDLSIQLFIENLILLDHIEELRAFAPLGLASASLSHDLAN